MQAQKIPALGTSLALFAATCLFQLLFLERGASLYDEGSIIAIGDLLSHGAVLYRDVLTFVAPFTYELMGVLYRIFGAHILVGRVFLVLAFALVVIFAHRLFLKLVSPRAALLGALAIWPIRPLGFPVWSILNYSQVALLFIVATMLAAANWLASQRKGWLVAAGFLAGMTVVSKQDFGAHVSLAVGIAVLLDWWWRGPRSVRGLAAVALPLGCSAILPVAIMLSYYASYDAAQSLLERTILGPMMVPAQYGVPFPGFEPWRERADDLFMIVFAYFPAVFIELAWSGQLNVFDPNDLMPLELAVKTSYYLPMVAMAVVGLWVVRGRTSTAERSIMALIACTAVIGYLLIYRADWIHLMNLYTVAILPVVVAFGRWTAVGGWWRSVLPAVVLVSWWSFGAVATYYITSQFTEPIQSARGRILDVPRKSQEISQVLDYIDAEPADSRMIFLPHNPLFYFLSGRPILTPNDLVMPALVSDEQDDRNLADAVERSDVVIYNPKIFPTAPAALYEYAPQTATVLSSLFDREQDLTNSAIVLRKARERSPGTVVDLWSTAGDREPEPLRPAIIWSDEEAAEQPLVFRDHWMVYRVVAVRVDDAGDAACFERRHCVRSGETLAAMPISHPEGWGAGPGKKLRFEVRMRTDVGEQTLYESLRDANTGPERIRVPLERLQGQCIDLVFCATAEEAGVTRGLAGWGELAIVPSR